MSHIAVIGGGGHIGLPLAVALAMRRREGKVDGWCCPTRVLAVDLSAKAVDSINSGVWPFHESSFGDADGYCNGDPAAALEELVKTGVLHACQGDGVPDDPIELKRLISASAIIFAASTDSASDAHGDNTLALFRSVVESLVRQPGSRNPLLVIRSTIPPGTMCRLQTVLDGFNLAWPLAYAPERTAQGRALLEILTLPQLIGANTVSAFDAARQLFGALSPKLIRLTPLEAEYAKLIANSWRYASIALSNNFFETVECGLAKEGGKGSFGRVLQAIKVDYPRAANLPDPGFCGGPCLPKDARMLVAAGEKESTMMAGAIEVNSIRLPKLAVERLGDLQRKKVTLLGAAFKPESDDLRGTLAIEVARLCVAGGAREVALHDPLFESANEKRDCGLIKTADLDHALNGTDGVIVCCPHPIYRSDPFREAILRVVSNGIPLVDINNHLNLSPAPSLEIITPKPDHKLIPATGPRKLTVLVTGSAGFVGAYLVDELLAQGYHVIGLDNHSKYGPDALKPRDLNPNYEFICGDAKDVPLLTKLVGRSDYLIAGAAIIGGISLFHARAYDLIAENDRIMAAAYDAAIAVWEGQRAAREARLGGDDCTELGEIDRPVLRKVVVISSSMVFENTKEYPTPEGAQLTSPPPSSTYGFQKLACEYYARGAYEQYGVPFTIVRPFNCVGIGERRTVHKAGAKLVQSGNVSLAMSHVVPDLIQKVLKGQDPLRLLGSGGQVRHFTYAGDLARGIRMAMENPLATNEDFNLSSARSTTILELAELIWKKCKPGVPFRYETEVPFTYDVQVRVPDVSKAKRALGFEATTELEEMLERMVPWVEEQLELDRI